MALQEGDVLLGRYEVVRPVKTGGMGAVYKARDLQFADRGGLALKEMLSDFSDEDTRELIKEKFNEEARTLVNLSHAGIPRVWDHFIQGDVHYIVMEFIEGDSLEQMLDESLTLARTPLDPRLVCRIAIQLCQILQYLHTRPGGAILHRDVKPANIILRRESQDVVLVDFGLARTFDAASLSTKTTVGTLGYAPMEQLRGRPEPASDIYGVGATMYHLLTGKRPQPFERSRLSTVLPGAPAPLLEVVDKSLEEDPAQRFASVAEMRVALEYLLPVLEAAGPISIEGMATPRQPSPDTRAADLGPADTRAPHRTAVPASSLLKVTHLVTEHVPPRARIPVAAGVLVVVALLLLGLGRVLFLRLPGASLFDKPEQASSWRVVHAEACRYESDGLVIPGAAASGRVQNVAGLVLAARSDFKPNYLSFLVQRKGNPDFQVFVDDIGFESREGEAEYQVDFKQVASYDSSQSLRDLSFKPLGDQSESPPKLLMTFPDTTKSAVERYHLQWGGSQIGLSAGWYSANAPPTRLQPEGGAAAATAPSKEPQMEVGSSATPTRVTRLILRVMTKADGDYVRFSHLRLGSN